MSYNGVMKTLEFHGEVGADGKLRVEMPVNLPPGPVEGVVVVQSLAPPPSPPYDTLEGALKGLVPDVDIDEILREASTAWKEDLEDL